MQTKITKSKAAEIAQNLIEEGEENTGVCLACGEVHEGIEPDARKYKCEACGQHKVYGSEEILLMFGPADF
jgi:rubrerythrin